MAADPAPLPDPAAELAALRARVAKLEKINQALLKQVEGAQGQDSAFSMFQTAILLDRKVRERTDDLEAALQGLQESHRALNAAKAEADAASHAKSEFLAVMSHEIRTPLNGVIGVADLLLGDELGDEQRRLVETIRSSGGVLLRIISDILDFSKVEAGRLSLQAHPFSIDELLADVRAMFIDQATAGGITLTLARPAAVHDGWMGDQGRIRQILINLVGNALKFTSHGSVTIGVAVEPVRPGGELLRFTVTDTGLDIAPEILAHLFEPFHVADSSSSRRFGGTGLGLAIVKRLARLMGGDARVRSEVGRGTEVSFTLSIPRADLAPRPAPVTAMVRPFSCRADVLVVEDNPVNQLVTTRTLERFGCRVRVANNGVEALLALGERPFDLVFMDCHMPELDGYDATRELRRRGSDNAAVPVIALTANAMRHDRELCLSAGMDDYASKPVKPAHLQELLAKWLPTALVSGPAADASSAA